MKLLVYWTDMRGGYGTRVFARTNVIDQDTGKTVGFVDADRSPIKRHISLFDGKYQGSFEDGEQCDAFAKGVEAVWNHMTEATEEQAEAGQAAWNDGPPKLAASSGVVIVGEGGPSIGGHPAERPQPLDMAKGRAGKTKGARADQGTPRIFPTDSNRSV